MNVLIHGNGASPDEIQAAQDKLIAVAKKKRHGKVRFVESLKDAEVIYQLQNHGSNKRSLKRVGF